MHSENRRSNSFKQFTQSGKASGVVLILCTIVSLTIASSPINASTMAILLGAPRASDPDTGMMDSGASPARHPLAITLE